MAAPGILTNDTDADIGFPGSGQRDDVEYFLTYASPTVGGELTVFTALDSEDIDAEG